MYRRMLGSQADVMFAGCTVAVPAQAVKTPSAKTASHDRVALGLIAKKPPLQKSSIEALPCAAENVLPRFY
jgi:hypothetical protein